MNPCQWIHYTSTPPGICKRKDDKVDVLADAVSEATSKSAVTCPQCQTWMKANKKRRERMLEKASAQLEAAIA